MSRTVKAVSHDKGYTGTTIYRRTFRVCSLVNFLLQLDSKQGKSRFFRRGWPELSKASLCELGGSSDIERAGSDVVRVSTGSDSGVESHRLASLRREEDGESDAAIQSRY